MDLGSRRLILGVLAIVFVASATMTIAANVSMSAMGEMPMPGGWRMSHMWMRRPGQTWSGASASFVGMWVVMMIAMMMPSLIPTLLCYRESAGRTGASRPALSAALVAVGYFVVWSTLGAIVFPLGVVSARIIMQNTELSRAIPAAVGVTVLIAGVVQRTAWKARHLERCRDAAEGRLTSATSLGAALQHGLRLGLHCCQACAGLTAAALALGVMDLRVMAVLMAAITAERLTPARARAARATGLVVAASGLAMVARVSGS